MKQIVKYAEPQQFVSWETANPDATYQDLRNDSLFPGATIALSELRKSLAAEQGHLCCYCETLIDNGDFHIEHFRPKCLGKFPELQLTYSNLHACCHKRPTGCSDECCGRKKSNFFDNILISPLEENCESHFKYDIAGNIYGLDERGDKTISVMNLNSALLIKSRKSLIEYFEDLTDEEYDDEIVRHLNSSGNPLGEFYTTIKYLHSQGFLH